MATDNHSLQFGIGDQLGDSTVRNSNRRLLKWTLGPFRIKQEASSVPHTIIYEVYFADRRAKVEKPMTVTVIDSALGQTETISIMVKHPDRPAVVLENQGQSRLPITIKCSAQDLTAWQARNIEAAVAFIANAAGVDRRRVHVQARHGGTLALDVCDFQSRFEALSAQHNVNAAAIGQLDAFRGCIIQADVPRPQVPALQFWDLLTANNLLAVFITLLLVLCTYL